MHPALAGLATYRQPSDWGVSAIWVVASGPIRLNAAGAHYPGKRLTNNARINLFAADHADTSFVPIGVQRKRDM